MNQITIVGRLGRDIELRFSGSGNAVGRVGVATTRGRDDDKETTWHDVILFGEMAEQAAANVSKGDRVIVVGRIQKRDWEKDGRKGTAVEVIADEFGPSLRWARDSIRTTAASPAAAPEDPF